MFYAESNKQLAQEAADRRARERQADRAASIAHVNNQRDSAWLTENPANGVRVGGVRRDQWKGMNVSQLQSHYDAQYEQMLEKQRAKQAQAMEDARFAQMQRQIQDAMQQVTLKEQMEHTQMQMDYRLMQA